MTSRRSRTFYLGAAAGFLGGLLVSELLCRTLVRTGWLFDHVDFGGTLTSLPDVRDRLRAVPRSATLVCLLGDSIPGAGALAENGEDEPRRKALGFRLGRLVSPRAQLVTLTADGLLLPDLEALSCELALRPPDQVVLLLNVRMFAPQFREGPAALSRAVFAENLPPDERTRLATRDTTEGRITRAMEGLTLHWTTFRVAQLLKTRWYFPSRTAAMQRLLGHVAPRRVDADLEQAVLKSKVAGYYEATGWDTSSLPFRSLARLVARLVSQGTRVTVVLSPQNLAFLEGIVDREALESNRQRLARFMADRADGAVYLDWATRFPEEQFLDHCHLTAEGNERLARDLESAVLGAASREVERP